MVRMPWGSELGTYRASIIRTCRMVPSIFSMLFFPEIRPQIHPLRRSIFGNVDFWSLERGIQRDMSKKRETEHLQLALLFIFLGLLHFCSGEIGTAGHYAAPYLPTACYGNDVSKFPSSNLFASAGDGIWDNGAACSRQYFVRCLSAQTPGTCKAGEIIKVKIVDRASRSGAILVLSTIAFGAIANPSAALINIEFAEA